MLWKSKKTRQNGQYLQWQSLLTNRTKRTQGAKFFVQGVRPINAVMNQQLIVDSLLYRSGKLFDWATQLIAGNKDVKRYELSADLMKELGEKNS